MIAPLRTVVFWKTPSGNEPVREWLRSCSNIEQKRIGTDLAKLQFYQTWGSGSVKPLRDGLWELRTSLKRGEARLLFFEDGNKLVVVYGFWKKTRKTPPDVIREALDRKKAYEN